MLENKHNLTVDTQSKSIGNAFVEVVQNDNVALEVQIYNNNLLVDNTAYTYTLLSVLPSKERIIRQGSIGPNGYPVFYLGVEEMSETGIILAMVQVFDELGNRVTSYDFKYRMKEDMSTGGVVPSADNPKFVIVEESLLTETLTNSQTALENSEQAVTTSNSVQEQFNQVVINGDSSVEAAQARVNADGSVTYATLKDRLDTEYEKVTAQYDRLDTEYEKVTAQYDNLQIGGVNLINDSKFRDKPKNGGYITLTDSGLPQGEYTISFDYEVVEENITIEKFLIYAETNVGYVPLKSAGESRTKLTFKINATMENKPIRLYFGKGHMDSSQNHGIFKEIQIEKGNKATDWSPSPQDTQNQIDGLGNRVLMLEGKIEELEGRILSLEGV